MLNLFSQIIVAIISGCAVTYFNWWLNNHK
ncbi:hypothetical protein DS831_06485 [Bombilactobacillus bombi]|uniref:Type I toxin-antitoxin system Fst family toxin n=1 Tax=Bombilactobacillus bombi TaxID=1303590 RepID=A0A417ZEY1_9LACO|nr:type I toxin-antitoxin system Fst family toxin [Bombilactobacillus bombi]RHW49808.1 hypothetical protein DS831_06485 [Bombilactobacillus bombi]